MKPNRTILICLVLIMASCDKNKEIAPTDVSAWKGVVLNEIAAHDENGTETWIELLNTGSAAVDLAGLGLYITDEYFTGQSIWQASENQKLGAGERLILSTSDETLRTGISSAAQFVLKLAVEDGTAVDEFDRSKTLTEPASCYARGSYQRIPDGGEVWKDMPYNSRNTANKVFSLEDYKHTAIWTWSSHVAGLMENDAAKLKEFKRLGYDHILLNYAAFQSYNLNNTLPFLQKCEDLGLVVHCWMQCFYNGGWISPVDDDNKCYKEDVFSDIREHAKAYIENFGVKGLHLDYIRFGGTAYKHNPTPEVTAAGAVNRCCKEIREIADSYEAGIVTSAALMPERNSTEYYGQNPAQMGKYIHILMPMCYRYSYKWNDAGCKSIVNWFCDNSGGAEVWAGITTYTGNDTSGVQGMDATAMRKDIDIFMDSQAKGLVLFRCGLGTFPDVNDLN